MSMIAITCQRVEAGTSTLALYQVAAIQELGRVPLVVETDAGDGQPIGRSR